MLWCTTLTALPSLWTHLDLAYIHHPVPINTIRDYIRRSNNGLARASVQICKSRNDMMLWDALLRCSTLKHLDINITGGVHDCTLLKSIPSFAGLQVLVLSTHVSLPFESVMKLLGSCKVLSRAEFHRVEGSMKDAEWTDNVSVIRSLTINGVRPMSLHVHPETLVSNIFRPVGTQSDMVDQTPRANPTNRTSSLFLLALWQVCHGLYRPEELTQP